MNLHKGHCAETQCQLGCFLRRSHISFIKIFIFTTTYTVVGELYNKREQGKVLVVTASLPLLEGSKAI